MGTYDRLLVRESQPHHLGERRDRNNCGDRNIDKKGSRKRHGVGGGEKDVGKRSLKSRDLSKYSSLSQISKAPKEGTPGGGGEGNHSS